MRTAAITPFLAAAKVLLLFLILFTFVVVHGQDVQTNPNHNGANLVYTKSSLLSGRSLIDCQSVNDDTCVGGVAHVAALTRYYGSPSQTGNPSTIIPSLDYSSSFVQMHPLGWNVNRLVMNYLLGFEVFIERPWIFDVEGAQQRSLGGLQTIDWPLLLSNVKIPPSNTWNTYTKNIHFDPITKLATLVIVDTEVKPFDSNQIESTKTLLDYITKVNELNQGIGKCGPSSRAASTATTSLSSSSSLEYDEYLKNNGYTTNNGNTAAASAAFGTPSIDGCWIPVILYRQQNSVDANELFLDFINQVSKHVNPPAFIMDVEGNDRLESYTEPVKVHDTTFVVSFRASSRSYYQAQLTFNNDRTWISEAKFVTQSLADLPNEAKDNDYSTHISTLRKLADETIQNDPIVGTSTFMPVNKANGFVWCEAGECPSGNMFTDAMKWYTNVDFAFSNSGAYHGLGWNAGNVKVSNIWDTFPFANTLCEGTMTGLSMYRLFNYSTSAASFTATDSPDDGLLQISSGLRVTYNTKLSDTEYSKLVNLELWNTTTQQYVPIDRLQTYTFVTDSYNCRVNHPFNDLAGPLLTVPGEVPSKLRPEIIQSVVADYLTQLDHPYNTTIQGRLVNDTSIETGQPMENWIHTEDTCPIATYWVPSYQTCFECPTTEGVYFQQDSLEFAGVSGIINTINGANNHQQEIILLNEEEFPVDVVLKSLPPFISYEGSYSGFGNQQESITIEAGSSLPLIFQANTEDLNAGTAVGEISLSISDGGYYPGCVGNDVKFTVKVHVSPMSELNLLGWISYFGWALSFIAVTTSMGFARWCYKHRGHKVLDAMQPAFLLGICLGVIILALALVPMSIDDGIVSEMGCNIACMGTPWLLSVGFTVAFSAIFSKLWRINQMVANIQAFRRVRIMEHDVLGPFIVLFILNVSVMTAWTIIDPLRWVRISHDDEPWNSYGACRGSSSTSDAAFWSVIGIINLGCLALACYQAYLSRKLSDDYSESKSIGFAIFSWFQLSVVGIPVLVLLDEGNSAKNVLQAGLLFAVCVSLLLSIFLPIMKSHQKVEYQMRHGGPERRITESLRVTGIGEVSYTGRRSREMTGGSDDMSGELAIEKNSRPPSILKKGKRALGHTPPPKKSVESRAVPESAKTAKGLPMTSWAGLDAVIAPGEMRFSSYSSENDLNVIEEEDEDEDVSPKLESPVKKPKSKRNAKQQKVTHQSPGASKSPGKSPRQSPLRRLIPKLPIWEQLGVHGRLNESCVEPAALEDSQQEENSEKPDSSKDLESQLTMDKMDEHNKSFSNMSSGNTSGGGGDGSGPFWSDYKVNKTVPVPSWAVVDMTGTKLESNESKEVDKAAPEQAKSKTTQAI